jgi:hypothetical protein
MRSPLSESVMVIRISVHTKGEEPDQHVVRAASRVSRMTTVREVPNKSNLGPCSWYEVLAPRDHLARPSSWAASFSLQQTPLKQGDTVRQSNYWLLGLPGPINPTCGQYKSKLAMGTKTMRSLIDTGRGYHL